MGWADRYIEILRQGEQVSFRPHGNSMRGKIDSGQLVTVAPIGERVLQRGDIVLCRVKGTVYVHLIKAIQGARYQIGNNRGGINGWISAAAIFGIVVEVEGAGL